MATRTARESELWLLGICVLHGRTWRDYFAQGKCFLWRKGFAELSRRAQQVEGPWYKTRKVNYFQVKYLMFHLIYSCALNMVHIFFQGLGICGISIFLCWLNRIWAAATFPFFFCFVLFAKKLCSKGKMFTMNDFYLLLPLSLASVFSIFSFSAGQAWSELLFVSYAAVRIMNNSNKLKWYLKTLTTHLPAFRWSGRTQW